MIEENENSAFHPDNYNKVMIITFQRMYDLLAVIARGVNLEEANKVIDLHDEGYFMAAAPAFRE